MIHKCSELSVLSLASTIYQIMVKVFSFNYYSLDLFLLFLKKKCNRLYKQNSHLDFIVVWSVFIPLRLCLGKFCLYEWAIFHSIHCVKAYQYKKYE